MILDWLSNQKNNVKSIDDFTYDTTKKIIGLKKDGYMFYFMIDGTEIEMYNINYELAGGTNEENAIMSYSKGDTVQLPIPTKEGAYFLGWSRNNNDAENTISNITSDMEGDITLYACWLEETSKDYFVFSTNSDGQTTTITGFTSEAMQKYANGEIKELVLPTKDKNGLQVTNIGANAFSGKDKIEKLVIPENATVLGDNVFSNCTGIKYLQIPISTNCLGNKFSGVTNIEEIYFSKGTGEGLSLGSWQSSQRPWYQSREKLTKVTLERGITSIGGYMFHGCGNITNTWEELVNNREELINIGEAAFAGCSGIKGELVIPNGISALNSYTFNGCTGIERLVIPENVTQLGDNVFLNCTGIKYLKIPISTNYWNNKFSGVTNIEEIYFSKGTGVGLSLANWQASGALCYQSREKLTKVTLENGITSIGDYTFYGCSNISEVYYTGSLENWNLITIGVGNGNITKLEVQCAS